MDQVTPDDSSSPKTATRIAKHQPLLAPFSEAAKSLLSSPLPPELVVDFKSTCSLFWRRCTDAEHTFPFLSERSED
jgi:hypothetical protein